jgi:hypothetical protein
LEGAGSAQSAALHIVAMRMAKTNFFMLSPHH